jgi:hypothetical protein
MDHARFTVHVTLRGHIITLGNPWGYQPFIKGLKEHFPLR